jgi:hypothetical protein
MEQDWSTYPSTTTQSWNTNWNSGTACEALPLSYLSSSSGVNNAPDANEYQNYRTPNDRSTTSTIENQKAEESLDDNRPQEVRNKGEWNSLQQNSCPEKSKARRIQKSSSRPNSSHQPRINKASHKLPETKGNWSSNNTNTARTNHNLIEKNYRTRLNGQFETLLSVLPEDVLGERVSSSERKVSKAEVLILASTRISQLENARSQLKGEQDELLGQVDLLREQMTPSGNNMVF